MITDRNGKPLKEKSLDMNSTRLESLDRTQRMDGFRKNSMMTHHSDITFKKDKELNKTIDYSELYSYLPGPKHNPSDHKINVLRISSKLAAASSPQKSPRPDLVDFDDYGVNLRPAMFSTGIKMKK